jgi:hypothetical protein
VAAESSSCGTAYSSRKDGICVMSAGSVPVKRFSAISLPHRHKCKAKKARNDRARATYSTAIDGIEAKPEGNVPVSEFRAMLLPHSASATHI